MINNSMHIRYFKNNHHMQVLKHLYQFTLEDTIAITM
nr:MAG TPA: hypothetical protein [Caudoviricetes sp.]DAR26071.1 MAG TPA: hypothetical protein [Caudoviricetes sp.]DAX54695.1 MAG TPA: hypothetical protein [Caudoviricetes sp.]